MGELLVKFDGQTRSFLIGGMRFHLASDYVFTGEKRDVLYRALVIYSCGEIKECTMCGAAA